jgi:hypothetical protein
MKLNLFSFEALSLLCAVAGTASLNGQVIINPNHISGTVRFTNANPAILSLLNAPGDEGMSNVWVRADSLPPAPPISATTDMLPVSSRTSAEYQVTVDSASPGIAYAVTPYVVLQGDQYTYWFSNRASAPVTIGVTPPPLNFDECVGVVTIQFVDSGNVPVPVDGGLITAYDSAYGYSGQRGSIPAGATEQRIYLRGGETHHIDITLHRGTNFYTDRIESFLSTNVAVTCDQFTNVQMVIPSSGSLAQITGTVDMAGKFELTVEGNKVLNYPDYTTVIATGGPFQNQRWGALGGTNFTSSSSGAYTLSNVVPTTLDPLSAGYMVYAQMAFGSNRTIETFTTPALGYGGNAPLAVLPGASVDLGNLFSITPGYLRGRVLLQGPAEGLGHTSLFRGMLHAGDNTTDGIPDYLGTYGVYWSTVQAEGVDRRAAGAAYTAAYGLGQVDFDGAFNPATSAYEGQYEAAVGGLGGENSLWRADNIGLVLESGAITNDNDYYYNVLTISDLRTNESEVVPGQAVTNDIAYCFSEVKIVFRTTAGTFYNPQIRFSQGLATDYSVNLEIAAGTPTSSATASNIGQVVMYLPQGDYRLYPSVTPGSGTYALAGLEPIDLTVGCRQQITLEPCLQLSLEAPACTNQPTAHITGSVRSCTNQVASISYTLNGGPAQPVCNNCGADPAFSFDVALSGQCLDNTLVVTATDDLGGISSVTTAIHYNPTAPVIQCPTDLAAGACDTNGTVVNFAVTATDTCAGPVTIVCTPPSGSVFPVGITTVTCVASDACGNSSQCSFTVTVTAGGSLLAIEPAVIIRWTCGGTLQSADDITGPWTDILGATSPYAVATSAAHKFYRVRN